MTTKGRAIARRRLVGKEAERVLASVTTEGLAANVGERVVGQGEAVRCLCGFLIAALRRISLLASGTPSSELPHLSAMAIDGPSGCGKTLMVESACEALGGLPVHVIDGSSLTGAGWRGGDLEAHKRQLAEIQATGRPAPVLVFVDEADKLAKAGDRPRDGFDPCEGFLRLLDGDGVESVDPPSGAGDKGPLPLDRGTLIFVFAGAFTGLGDHVRSRVLGAAGSCAGFSADSAALEARSLDEAGLRALATPEDLISWGLPRELVGRFSALVSARPLGEADLEEIARGGPTSVEARFARMMPEGCSLAVDDGAARLIVRAALESDRGARGLEASLAPVAFRALEEAGRDRSVVSVTVTARGGALALEVERGERAAGDRCETPTAPDLESEKEEGAWEPPSRVIREAGDLARTALRLALLSPGTLDPVSTVGRHDEARAFSWALLDALLPDMGGEDARMAYELLYGCLCYALDWGAPGDANSRVLSLLVGEAAEGRLLDRVLELWDGRSREEGGGPSRLSHGALSPGARRDRAVISHFGIDPNEDSALRHILYYHALAGERSAELAGRVGAGLRRLAGGHEGAAGELCEIRANSDGTIGGWGHMSGGAVDVFPVSASEREVPGEDSLYRARTQALEEGTLASFDEDVFSVLVEDALCARFDPSLQAGQGRESRDAEPSGCGYDHNGDNLFAAESCLEIARELRGAAAAISSLPPRFVLRLARDLSVTLSPTEGGHAGVSARVARPGCLLIADALEAIASSAGEGGRVCFMGP